MESKLDMGPATVIQESASVKRVIWKVSYMIIIIYLFLFFTFFIRSYIRYEHVSQKSK